MNSWRDAERLSHFVQSLMALIRRAPDDRVTVGRETTVQHIGYTNERHTFVVDVEEVRYGVTVERLRRL